MGSVVKPGEGTLAFAIEAADAIDRVEILRNNVLDTMAVHAGTWEETEYTGVRSISLQWSLAGGRIPSFIRTV